MEFIDSKNTTKTDAPKVTDYLDYRSFMNDYYGYQKAHHPKFSHATWSQQAGFKSRSFLRLVMLGKRALSPDSIPLTAKALSLGKQETDYFTNLVNYNQSTQFQSREYFLKKLMKVRTNKSVTSIHDSYLFLANHYVPRLQTLLAMPGLNKTEENLMALLKMTSVQFRTAIDALSDLGLAKFDESTKTWSSKVSTFSVPDDLGNVALQSFHKKSLEEAISAIDLPKQTRHFSSLILNLTTDQYQDLIKEVDAFTDNLLLKYKAKNPEQHRVYQINFNFIPVSEVLIQDETSRVQETPIFTDTNTQKEIL